MEMLNLPDVPARLDELAERVVEGHERVAVVTAGGGVFVLVELHDVALTEDAQDALTARARLVSEREDGVPLSDIIDELIG